MSIQKRQRRQIRIIKLIKRYLISFIKFAKMVIRLCSNIRRSLMGYNSRNFVFPKLQYMRLNPWLVQHLWKQLKKHNNTLPNSMKHNRKSHGISDVTQEEHLDSKSDL